MGRIRRWLARLAGASAPPPRLEAPSPPPAAPKPPPSAAEPELPPGPRVDFTCNVCGLANQQVPLVWVENREHPSCKGCASSLRMRSMVHNLALALHGRPLALPDFPEDRSVKGLGMSDWGGYAERLAAKHDYVNTFYHQDPRLDITNLPDGMEGRYRFLMSSDVFEHIPPEGLEAAFRNSRRLLADDGFFVFCVPYELHGETQEHFPRLHDFRIEEVEGRRRLFNRTVEGEEEIFDDLNFHGGDGFTLEMRLFSAPDLMRRLERAGFSSMRICAERYEPFGILWPIQWAVPILARA